MPSTTSIQNTSCSIPSPAAEPQREKASSFNRLSPHLATIITSYTRESENKGAAGYEIRTHLPAPEPDAKSNTPDHKFLFDASSSGGDTAAPGVFNLDALIMEIMLAAEDQNNQIQQTQKLTLEATETLASDTAAQGSDLEWATMGTMAVGMGMGAFQVYGAASSGVTNSDIENDPAMKELGSANFRTSAQLENTAHNDVNLSETEWSAKCGELCATHSGLGKTLGSPRFSVNGKQQTAQSWEDQYNAIPQQSRPFVNKTGSRNFTNRVEAENGDIRLENEKGLTSQEWDARYNENLGNVPEPVRTKEESTLGSRNFQFNSAGLTRDQWEAALPQARSKVPELAALGKYEFQVKVPDPNQVADQNAPATNERGLTKAQWEKGYEKVSDRLQVRAQNRGAVRTGVGQSTMQLLNILSGIMQQQQYEASATASTSSAEQNTMSSGTNQNMSTASGLRQAITTILSNEYTESSARMA